MSYRKKLSKKASKRLFKKTSHSLKVNGGSMVSRGGIRL